MGFHWLDLILSLLTYAIIFGASYFYFKGGNRGNTGSDGDGGVSNPDEPELDLPPGVCLPEEPIKSSPLPSTPAEIFS